MSELPRQPLETADSRAVDERRQTILYLIETGGHGGAEENLVELASRLDRDRYRPCVCLLKDGWLRDALIRRGVEAKVIHLNRVWDWRVRLNIPLVWVLAALIARERVSLVHSYMFEMGIHGFLAGWVARVPVVVGLRGESHDMGSARRRFLLTVIARLGCHFTAVTDVIAGRLMSECGVPRSQVSVIANGVDLSSYVPQVSPQEARRLLGLPIEPFTVGTVARLEEVKGVDVLVKALSYLDGNVGPVQVIITGDGSQRSELERLSLSAPKNVTVRFLGARSDVPRILDALDVFVLPSRSEGMPNALLQAMAMGRACVASAVGGNTSLLAKADTGVLVPPDDPAALASAVARLCASPSRRSALGCAARREVVMNYGVEEMVKANERVYDYLIARRAGACCRHPRPASPSDRPEDQVHDMPGGSRRHGEA